MMFMRSSGSRWRAGGRRRRRGGAGAGRSPRRRPGGASGGRGGGAAGAGILPHSMAELCLGFGVHSEILLITVW